ncbi:MAG: adenylosuccinate lyase [Acidobacteria bacterium]|nr:adenylosuccinate lyase [Acidobacteriota bacterium]
MIPRYTRAEMGAIWSDENKYRQWLEVELAASESLAEDGTVPRDAAQALRAHAAFTVDRINDIEKEVRHDVIAFTTTVAESMKAAGHGEQARWFHYGMTSNDVVDTAQALQVKQSAALIRQGLVDLAEALKKRAFEFKGTLQIGRTHGIQAEPITFGWKLALFYDEILRNIERFDLASEQIRFGKISGAVGVFAHIGPDAETRICEKLGLRPAPIASQVISRDRHASFVNSLALICAALEKIAMEVRHLQRTEVREVEEPFATGQKGSSAMPHKKNPIVCEQICGLARVVRSNALAAYENISLWHERDISHSSVERVVLTDSCILTDYLLSKTIWLVRGMRVHPQRMLRNLHLTMGLIFSGQVLLDLAAKGMSREDAYRLVQSRAMRCWEEDGDFAGEIKADPEIRKYLSEEELAHTFSLDRQLSNIDRIFARVFGV